MSDSKPEVLYKYRSINKFTLDTLVSNQIYFPTPAKFNDPFDTKCSFSKSIEEASYEEAKRVFGSDTDNMHLFKAGGSKSAAIDKFIQELSQKGILSLCETKNNQLLWAHYASNHTGICIGFEVSNENSLGDSKHTHKVNYTESYPSISQKSLGSPRQRKEAQHRVLHTKSKLWSYEQEWRCIYSEGDKEYIVPGRICEINFGCRTTNSDKSLIKRILAGSNLKFYQAEMKQNDFGLKFRLAREF
ncbi:MAG: DUF2971 domain-containing protein [Pseudomonadota bacterium]|nr:DUF2971 domain-containing protein [Pseudomonadota bacterium]